MKIFATVYLYTGNCAVCVRLFVCLFLKESWTEKRSETPAK